MCYLQVHVKPSNLVLAAMKKNKRRHPHHAGPREAAVDLHKLECNVFP